MRCQLLRQVCRNHTCLVTAEAFHAKPRLSIVGASRSRLSHVQSCMLVLKVKGPMAASFWASLLLVLAGREYQATGDVTIEGTRGPVDAQETAGFETLAGHCDLRRSIS